MRKYRKREHLENCLRTSYVGDTLFEDVFLYHNSLPDLDFNNLDTSVEFLGKKLDFPLIINAMTGGTDFSKKINVDLAQIADKFNIAMAVGSETIALEDEDAKESFKCVREELKNGVVLANLNGYASVDNAKVAIDLIEADGLQIHLNPAHELAMEEGDRDFRGILKNIEKIVNSLDKPIIVKEVGFGLSKFAVKELYDIGVRYVDLSGSGGTNFIEVENLRTPYKDLSDLYSWGNPTAMILIEAKALNLTDLTIIGSGGIKSSLDIVKALVLGADLTAISGEILHYLVHGGLDYAEKYVENLIYKTKMLMVLTGSKNIKELKEAKYKLTGKLKDLTQA
ncbi:type 2 isopentenyl-diphosphate Delta-isomerase [Peptoniphilus catoniae]|uniref:type 2 isopentenyl-diphosphate Delta-isomerase n=1 Tax=Peptoniphilus catoniae TaxID=1660341 RepID=UPI0010FF4FCA|nr:type 2 isopentenyl-diphosphate Delta-isomerase [Peptoniphilus catoniae]